MPDNYLKEAMLSKRFVTVYTTNGFQLKGTIFAECGEYIVLLSNGKNKMIYKHAISTVEPVENVCKNS